MRVAEVVAARRVAAATLTIVLVAGAATLRAQPLGYGIAGPAGVAGFFSASASEIHAAGGGELRAAPRVGAGVEFGVFGSSRVLLVLSLNGTVHLSGSTPARVIPYLSSGYTRFGIGDGDGPFNTWNIGGGFDYWARRRTGLRVELRDHVRLDTRGTVQYWSLRGGIVFR
jgi:hypothetical protein